MFLIENVKSALERELERVQDVEVLREFSYHLASENERMRALIGQVLEEKARLAQQKLSIVDQLKVLRKIIFGKSSEKRKKGKKASDRPRSVESQAFLLHGESLAPAPLEEETKDLQEELEDHELTEEEKKEEASLRDFECPQWEEIEGLYEESTEITVVERTYKKIRHRRKKYRLTDQQQCPQGVIITAGSPDKLLPGAHYSIDFAVSVVADKYLYHCPLQRQVHQMDALGLHGVSVKTLWNLCSSVAIYLEPLAERIRKEIVSSPLSKHVDESPWPILDPQSSDGYRWRASNQAGSFYQFEPTRSGKILKDLLKGAQGSILTDGFSGYKRLHKLKHLKLAFCWAHVRRKFIDLEQNYPKDVPKILDLIDELFKIEREAKDRETLARLRQEKSKPVIKELYRLLLEIKPQYLPEDAITKGIVYTLKLWSGLTLFLEDPNISLSNNDAERALRHAVMGRKNFYGSKTINGADIAVTLYTMIESCKKVELDPKSFIAMTIRNIIRDEKTLTPLEYAKHTRVPKNKAA